MMRKKNYHIISSGFTIVELLVVITVMALLFSIGYGRFRDFSRRQALTAVARQIEGDIRLTQELALSGKKPGESDECGTLDAYEFSVNEGTDTYSIYAVCDPSWTGAEDGEFYKKGVVIPAGMSLEATGSNNKKVGFYTVGGGNDAGGGGYSIEITQDGIGNKITVFVTSGGNVNIGNIIMEEPSTPGPATPTSEPSTPGPATPTSEPATPTPEPEWPPDWWPW